MNQLPKEIIVKIVDELGDPEIFVQLSKHFPNRYIFPCLFKNVIVQHDYVDYALQKMHLLVQSDGQCIFRFWLEDSVKILSSDFDKFSLDLIKPYILGVEFRLVNKDQDTLYWSNKVKSFLSDTFLRSFLCDIRLKPTNEYRGIKKLTLYDPDLITCYGTTSITSLGLYDGETTTKGVILELSEKAFPSLKRLEVNSINLKVLDLNCPLRELRICNMSLENYPSIHRLRELKVLTLESKPGPRNYHRDLGARLPVEVPERFDEEKSESLESLIMKNVKCSSLSFHCFPNLKIFRFQGTSEIPLESIPVTLEEFSVFSSSFVDVLDFKRSNLKNISLCHSGIETLGNLFSECLNLSKVDLSYNVIKVIPDIIEHPSITWLGLERNELLHFGSFVFPKLKFLNLSSNPLITIGTLKGCQSLQQFNMSKCRLESIDFVTDLTELEVLNAEYNQINSVQPLTGKTKLKTLNLSYNKLKDIGAIRSCANLRCLLVSSNEIDKVDLVGLKYLSKVDVSNNSVSKLEDVNLSDSVNELHMKNNCMTLLGGSISLRNVKYLDLSSNNLRKVKDINELQSLETLDLSDSYISSLIGFDALKNLTILDLRWCPVKSIKGLDDLPNMKKISLSETNIKTLDGKYLRGMRNLTSLSIVNSSLKQLKNMTMLPIEELTVRGNNITILDGIERLFKLVKLDVSENRIKKVGRSFRDFPILRLLYLRSNCLKNASGLEKIKSYTEVSVFCDYIDTSCATLRQTNIRFHPGTDFSMPMPILV